MVMLALATLGFAMNFWAWALLSPLGPRFKELLGLSGPQQAMVVAVPVIVGSLGRAPVGALADRFGVPPLVMGYIHGGLGSYGVGLALLAVVAVATMVFTNTFVRLAANRRDADANRAGPATPVPGTI